MFFLLRCLFWISLVFVCLPQGSSGGIANAFLDLASTTAGSAAGSKASALAADAAKDAADRGVDWCKAHGEACADAVLAAMVAKQPEGRGARTVPAEAPGLIERVLRSRGAARG